MEIMTVRSGSNENCLIVKQNNYCILVDAGCGPRILSSALSGMNLSSDRIAAIFITHEHSDHIKGLELLLKKRSIPVFANRATLESLYYKISNDGESFNVLPTGGTASCPDMRITSFKTPHDAIESVGYRITDGKRTFSVCTDLGHVTDEVLLGIKGSDTILLESNYDEIMLREGPYTARLKSRILSKNGHLSNSDCASYVPLLAQHGTTKVFLGHLSQTNNTPQKAYDATAYSLSLKGIKPGKDIMLYVASRTENSVIAEV